ncbi:hypothetical protein [Sphingomonas sp.]|uniref:hypothetical protein n=1 Tax=Sphingomonas sp. TaxID=28214 RepID=UPI00307CDFE8
MADLLPERVRALAGLSYLPGSWDKRFVRDVNAIVAAGQPLSPKQRENVDRLARKYRRQMPARLVPEPSDD